MLVKSYTKTLRSLVFLCPNVRLRFDLSLINRLILLDFPFLTNLVFVNCIRKPFKRECWSIKVFECLLFVRDDQVGNMLAD